MIDLLVGSRLVTSDDGVVEIAHEALARAWPRLRDWLEEDIEGQRTLHHLAAAADSWDALGRPDSELYRGVRLAKGLEWRARTNPSLRALEREFLDASEQLSHAELAAAGQRPTTAAGQPPPACPSRHRRGTARGGRGGRRLRSAADPQAETAAESARHAAVAEQARRIGANAQLAPDISESLLLAIQGVRLDDSPETRVNLLAAMARQPHLVRSVPGRR